MERALRLIVQTWMCSCMHLTLTQSHPTCGIGLEGIACIAAVARLRAIHQSPPLVRVDGDVAHNIVLQPQGRGRCWVQSAAR